LRPSYVFDFLKLEGVFKGWGKGRERGEEERKGMMMEISCVSR